jgi:cytochrome c peroxidase
MAFEVWYYMHNGYLKSLSEVVHFYNTSQALPRCAQWFSWRESKLLAAAGDAHQRIPFDR